MITLVGAGNVAHWIVQRLQDSSRFPITQVYSRNISHARKLADALSSEAVDDLAALNPDNRIFLFAVSDDAYPVVLPQLPFVLPLALMTSGTVSCRCLQNHAAAYGVVYPLQTFTKSQDMGKLDAPMCIESDFLGEWKPLVWELARELSPHCHEVSEAQRARLHLAAVFACNFSNAMFTIAHKLLEEKGLPFEMLLPILHQTVDKLESLTPSEAQTGPAARRDTSVMQAHLDSLENDSLREIYCLMSDLIIQMQENEITAPTVLKK